MKIAIFGSTGGSGLAALRECIAAELEVTVLVRSKDKLIQLLRLPQNNTNNEDNDKTNTRDNPSNLSIVQGDVRDVEKVKEVIEGKDVIISAVGGVLSFANPFFPSLTDPTICHDAMCTIITALSQVQHAPRRLIALSTTGIDSTRDIPLAMVPLYYWLLHQPHQDKKNMEQNIIEAGNKGVIQEWIIIRPAFLTDGPRTETYRAGSGIIGYTVSRNDVGHFIAQNITHDRPQLCDFLNPKTRTEKRRTVGFWWNLPVRVDLPLGGKEVRPKF